LVACAITTVLCLVIAAKLIGDGISAPAGERQPILPVAGFRLEARRGVSA
jgi:hypothetical protein